MRTMKHWAIAAMTATALVLAGCGGGGSSTADGLPVEPGPTPAQTEHMAIGGAVAAAETAVDGLAATSTDADVAEANTAITMAQNALDSAEHISAAQALELDGELDDVRTSLTMAEGTIAEHRKMVTDAEAARVAAVTMSADTKLAAINAEGEQTTDAGLGGTDVTASGDAEGAYNLAIKRDHMATTVTVTVEGATDTADEKFMLAMDLGGGTTMHTRTMDADADGNVVQEVAIITTDIDPPKAVAFAMVDEQELNVRQDGETATEEDPNDALTVVEGTDDVNLPKIMSASFVPGAGSGTQLTFAADDSGTSDMDEADEVMGTYNGAMGTYRCNGSTACTVTLDADGMVTAISSVCIRRRPQG